MPEDRIVRRERDVLRAENDLLRKMLATAKVFEGEVGVFDWWVCKAVVRSLPCWQAVILRKGREAKAKRVVFVHEYGSAQKAVEAVKQWFSESGSENIGGTDIALLVGNIVAVEDNMHFRVLDEAANHAMRQSGTGGGDYCPSDCYDTVGDWCPGHCNTDIIAVKRCWVRFWSHLAFMQKED
jgi:hypothetical protein